MDDETRRAVGQRLMEFEAMHTALETEIARMRPIVEAACACRWVFEDMPLDDLIEQLCDRIDQYEDAIASERANGCR